jgi:hypothetical protein
MNTILPAHVACFYGNGNGGGTLLTNGGSGEQRIYVENLSHVAVLQVCVANMDDYYMQLPPGECRRAMRVIDSLICVFDEVTFFIYSSLIHNFLDCLP